MGASERNESKRRLWHRIVTHLPAARFVKRFEEGTLLEWFREHCKPIAGSDEAEAHAKQLFGFEPYGFGYFLNRLAEVAEAEGHHPDFCLRGWSRVTLSLTTHAIGGLSRNDFVLAAKVNGLLARPAA